MPSNSLEYQRKNYRRFWGSKKGIKSTSMRVLARRKMEKLGRVHKGDNLEVDHKRGIKGGNSLSNLRVITRLKNRRLGQKKATKSQLRNNKNK